MLAVSCARRAPVCFLDQNRPNELEDRRSARTHHHAIRKSTVGTDVRRRTNGESIGQEFHVQFAYGGTVCNAMECRKSALFGYRT